MAFIKDFVVDSIFCRFTLPWRPWRQPSDPLLASHAAPSEAERQDSENADIDMSRQQSSSSNSALSPSQSSVQLRRSMQQNKMKRRSALEPEVPSKRNSLVVQQSLANAQPSDPLLASHVAPMNPCVVETEEQIELLDCQDDETSQRDDDEIHQQTLDAYGDHSPNVTPGRTRAFLMVNYNDEDEMQNDLICMERSWVSFGVPMEQPISEKQKFGILSNACRLAKLPPPLPLKVFEDADWNYVRTFDVKYLERGQKFLSLKELEKLPRRHAKFPFCHPGPVVDTVSGTRDWFYADSIVQKVTLLAEKKPYYVVRWVGYADIYNTVEPERNVLGTAILELHLKKSYATAARSNGAVLIRRSLRGSPLGSPNTPVISRLTNDRCVRAMTLLDDQLSVEIAADRYSKAIGFHSKDGIVVNAVNNQFNFIKDNFIPIVNGMKSSAFHMSPIILGSLFGKNRSLEFEKVKTTTINGASSIKRHIFAGLKEAQTEAGRYQFVSFLVFAKHGSTDTVDDKHLDMHVCVYTVRSNDKHKDCVYHDPSPESHQHAIPKCIRDLPRPIMRSSTRTFGTPTQFEDCLYQCFKYIIELHAEERQFEPNVQMKRFPR